ncbi:integral membrane protein [Mycobacterium tuberculosis]|nr:integral membrane protein [Mycobacterium tuberculosis]
MNDILNEVGATFAYGAVGIALMALGYLVVEVTTPGRLGKQIWTEGNRGAALLLAVKLFGIGGIVFTAIITSDNNLGDGLVDTAVFGACGIVLMIIAFFLLDVITPGRLGATLVGADGAGTGTGIHPAGWVVAAADLGVAAIVAGAVS